MDPFDGTNGDGPNVPLTQHTNGILYGDTVAGGIAGCGDWETCGTFYSLDLGLQAFIRLLPPSGRVGKSIGILGQGLTGTTGVTFNGVTANFLVKSDTYLTATVPNGVTTGFVQVVTPSGTLTSNVPFRVLP